MHNTSMVLCRKVKTLLIFCLCLVFSWYCVGYTHVYQEANRAIESLVSYYAQYFVGFILKSCYEFALLPPMSIFFSNFIGYTHARIVWHILLRACLYTFLHVLLSCYLLNMSICYFSFFVILNSLSNGIQHRR